MTSPKLIFATLYIFLFSIPLIANEKSEYPACIQPLAGFYEKPEDVKYQLTDEFKRRQKFIIDKFLCQYDKKKCKKNIESYISRIIKEVENDELLTETVEELIVTEHSDEANIEALPGEILDETQLVSENQTTVKEALSEGVKGFIDSTTGGDKLEFSLTSTLVSESVEKTAQYSAGVVTWAQKGYKNQAAVITASLQKKSEAAFLKTVDYSKKALQTIAPSANALKKVGLTFAGAASAKALAISVTTASLLSLLNKKDSIEMMYPCNENTNFTGYRNTITANKQLLYVDMGFTYKGERSDKEMAKLIREGTACKPIPIFSNKTFALFSESEAYQAEKLKKYESLCEQVNLLYDSYKKDQEQLKLTVKSCEPSKIEVEIGPPYDKVLGDQVEYYGIYGKTDGRPKTFQSFYPNGILTEFGHLNYIRYNNNDYASAGDEPASLCLYKGGRSCLSNVTPRTEEKELCNSSGKCRKVILPPGTQQNDRSFCRSKRVCHNPSRYSISAVNEHFIEKGHNASPKMAQIRNLYVIDDFLTEPRFQIETCCQRLRRNGLRDPYIISKCRKFGSYFEMNDNKETESSSGKTTGPATQ